MLNGQTANMAGDELSADEFNLWCALNNKPYRLAKHIWPDGAAEWDIEQLTNVADRTIAYGTGQSDERAAAIAAFAFLAGIEWHENAILDAQLDDDAVEGEEEIELDEEEALEFDEEEEGDEEDAELVDEEDDEEGGEDEGDEEDEEDAEEDAEEDGDEDAEGDEDEEEEVEGEETDAEADDEEAEEEEAEDDEAEGEGYRLPSPKLLQRPPPGDDQVDDEATLAANARALEIVLRNFKVRGEIMEVRQGPVVTLYELEPVPGTKSSTVINLADDISRSMRAITARIAVVPGQSALGIELPNEKREVVYLREILTSSAFTDAAAKLPLALGKNIGGEPVVVDLAKMPHLLIAGTTGSGKSVGVNAMILSLLYRLPPDRCRFIMVDPKMLELSVYDGIPHLLAPVVTDPKKAVHVLKWAVREMENRYRSMALIGVRNIESFNQRAAELREAGETVTRQVQVGFDRQTREPIMEDQAISLDALPYIVIIVDEMADLMLVAGKEIEALIQRLAQMARAAGIHLIMATQRPSVDVITGTIKANFPTRISFQVTSKIDSRTILSEAGAEQLLGQGDMLYMQAGGRITRVHGPFVADSEVEDVVNFLKTQGEPEYLHDIVADEDDMDLPLAVPGGEDGGGPEPSGDDLYDQAVNLVLREGKVSVSFIQRYLQIGYNRAARIVERMETEGVVGPANHMGKRDILGGRRGGF